MIDKYGIDLLQMMENAGRNLAEMGRRMLCGSVEKRSVIIAAGRGNNGGGGLACGRHLHNWGAHVAVVLPDDGIGAVPQKQLDILRKLHVDVLFGNDALEYLTNWRGNLIIDALIGYGLSSSLKGWIGKVVEKINSLDVQVLSLDVPTGLDSTTGEIKNICVQANATMTLALPKTGLLDPEARKFVGTLYLADIGIPDLVYRDIGLDAGSIFTRDTIILLNGGEDDWEK